MIHLFIQLVYKNAAMNVSHIHKSRYSVQIFVLPIYISLKEAHKAIN